MKIKIVYNLETTPEIKTKNLSNKIKSYLKNKFQSGFDKNIELGIHFVSSAKIQKLNLNYRNIKKPTNVLSFPVYKNIKNSKAYIDNEINLGDIFICTDIAKHEAKINNISQDKKIEKLAIHGTKHLIGIHHQ